MVWVHDIIGAKSFHVIVLLFIFARVAWIWFEEASTMRQNVDCSNSEVHYLPTFETYLVVMDQEECLRKQHLL